jgi:hypothetical protein
VARHDRSPGVQRQTRRRCERDGLCTAEHLPLSHGGGLTKTVIIPEMSGLPIEPSRPAQASALYLSFSCPGSSTRVIEAHDLYPRIGDGDRSQHAFDLLTRVRNVAYTVDTELAKVERSLDRDKQRLDDLELVELSDFLKSAQLRIFRTKSPGYGAKSRRLRRPPKPSPETLHVLNARQGRPRARVIADAKPHPGLCRTARDGQRRRCTAMMHDKAIAEQLAAAQSTAGDGQLESGDTSTRPGNFLRAVDDCPDRPNRGAVPTTRHRNVVTTTDPTMDTVWMSGSPALDGGQLPLRQDPLSQRNGRRN